MRTLDDKRQALELESIGLEARIAETRGVLELQTARVKQSVERDEVMRELKTVLEAREQQLEAVRRMAEAGRAEAQAAPDAMAKLSEARLRLAERREAVQAAAGGDRVAAWNRQLQDLAIDLREKAAQLDLVTNQLARMREVAPSLIDLERLQRELPALQERVRQAEAAHRKAERNWRTRQQPQVTAVEEKDWTAEQWEAEMQQPTPPAAEAPAEP